MSNEKLSEQEVRKAVTIHFKQNRFSNFTVTHERDIQFGSGKGRKYGIADVVVLSDAKRHWVTIVECKSEVVGDTEEGRGQLRSYLSATDTRFGILAFNDNPDNWIYCENQRSNKFSEIDKSDFEERIFDPPIADRTDHVVLKRLTRSQTHLKIAFISTLLIIAACLLTYFLILLPIHTDTHYQVVRIIDGDTFEIKYKGKLTSVQLFGVNAPETTVHPSKPQEPYGQEAHTSLQDLLLDDSIFLRFDEHMLDQYERILGYVYRASDGIFVNLEMIREGYAEVDHRYPFKYEELFSEYESRAKSDRKGLWGRY